MHSWCSQRPVYIAQSIYLLRNCAESVWGRRSKADFGEAERQHLLYNVIYTLFHLNYYKIHLTMNSDVNGFPDRLDPFDDTFECSGILRTDIYNNYH